MYIAGFIQIDQPRVLINPMAHRSVAELYDWLERFFNQDDFSLDPGMIDEADLAMELRGDKPLQINIAGYQVALVFGDSEVMGANMIRFVHAGHIDIDQYMSGI